MKEDWIEKFRDLLLDEFNSRKSADGHAGETLAQMLGELHFAILALQVRIIMSEEEEEEAGTKARPKKKKISSA